MAEASAEYSEADAREAALADAMLGVVEQMHGPLDDAARAQLHEGLRRASRTSAALYSYPLTNADEPGTIFRPYRAD